MTRAPGSGADAGTVPRTGDVDLAGSGEGTGAVGGAGSGAATGTGTAADPADAGPLFRRRVVANAAAPSGAVFSRLMSAGSVACGAWAGSIRCGRLFRLLVSKRPASTASLETLSGAGCTPGAACCATLASGANTIATNVARPAMKHLEGVEFIWLIQRENWATGCQLRVREARPRRSPLRPEPISRRFLHPEARPGDLPGQGQLHGPQWTNAQGQAG